MLRLVLACAIATSWGCGAPARRRPDPPPAWRLVELEDRRLVLEREPPPRVEMRLSKERAAPGEIIEAEFRLADPRGWRRIRVRPSRPDVRILGPDDVEIEGAGRAIVRFTGSEPGRGGIEVLVTE